MSRFWLPRRLAAGIAVVAALCIGGGAAAQSLRGTSPATTVPLSLDSNARACADCAVRLDVSDAAIARCTRALREEARNPPNLVVTYINRGNIRMARGEFLDALEDFDASIGLDPRNAEARLNRGVALIALERYGLAIAALTEAVSLGVHEPHKAYYNRAAAREALGDLRGALEAYSTALEIQPDWGAASADTQRLVRSRQERLAQALEESDP